MVKNKGGAPTEYREEFIEEAYKYLKENQDVYEEKRINVKLPTIQGFAARIGHAECSMYAWSKAVDKEGRKLHPKFAKAIVDIKQAQHERVLNSGLSGDYNPTIAKLILSSNHGYKEKVETATRDLDKESDVEKMSLEDLKKQLKLKQNESNTNGEKTVPKSIK